MPTYIYKCKKCGKIFEYQQRITADALTKCPKEICDQSVKGAGEVERQISKNIGVLFSGSGFYQTDYNSSQPSTATKQDNKAEHTHTGNCCGCSSSASCGADISN